VVSVEPLRIVGPLVLALVSATAVDQLMQARRLQPPGFAQPGRRAAALMLTAAVFYVGVFLALAQVGLPHAALPTELSAPQLFTLHAVFVAAVLGWFLLGFAGYAPAGHTLLAVFGRQLGLAARQPLREVGIGLGLGLLVWPAVLIVLLLVAALTFALGGEKLLPQEPPQLVVWIAGLPVALRVAVALSAGVVEELFFRGFLQPRVGIGVSTLLFVLAHLSYDQPFMLVGITLLSLFFAGLVWWRQSLWSAIAAHFLFDAAQLLFVIPWALKQWPTGAKAVGPVLLALARGGLPGQGAPWLPW
jgi:membrane protease YdiL (CAAX protease family)